MTRFLKYISDDISSTSSPYTWAVLAAMSEIRLNKNLNPDSEDYLKILENYGTALAGLTSSDDDSCLKNAIQSRKGHLLKELYHFTGETDRGHLVTARECLESSLETSRAGVSQDLTALEQINKILNS